LVSKKGIVIFYIASILFVCIDLLLVFLHLDFIAALLPLAVLIFYWFLFSIDKLILLIVFCTPLSIRIFHIPGLSLGQIGVGITLPTEPIIFGIMLFYLLFTVYSRYDKTIIRHPVSIVILLSLLWMTITSFTSTMHFVSFKYLLEKSATIITFYFLGILLFKNIKNIYYFNWLYLSSLTLVIIYTLICEYSYHFSEKSAHIAVRPFYNDHTAYGAALAMFIPILGGLSLMKGSARGIRIITISLFVFFALALFFSFCRAAWVSILVASILLVIMLFRINLKWVFAGLCLSACLLFAFQSRILMKLQQNTTDVSDNIGNELQSISNVSSDASNLERLNRWSCAYRMWLDKPVFGYGPGTYMFNYAPYQLSYMETTISTDVANGGNAHSEYLGPLAEQGLMGMLTMLAIIASVFILSFRLFYNLKDRDMRILVVSIFLGLVTYFVHGMVNNFLDTDKAAVPFWGFIGMLVAIDIATNKELSDSLPNLI
jgi:putative inorganic carbon (hco3(-)) transporter